MILLLAKEIYMMQSRKLKIISQFVSNIFSAHFCVVYWTQKKKKGNGFQQNHQKVNPLFYFSSHKNSHTKYRFSALWKSISNFHAFFLQKKRPHKHARKKSCSFGSFHILFKTSLYPTAIQCQNRCMNIFIAILGLRVQLSLGTLHDNCNSLKWLALLGPLPHIYAPLWAYCHYLQAAALRAQRPSISFLP